MKPELSRLLHDLIHSDEPRYQLIRHLAVGGSGVIFNWLAFSALRHFTSLGTLECTIAVHVILLITIFPLQKLFTFQRRENGRRQAIRFLINDLGYVTFDYLLAYLFIDVVGLPPIIGKACGLAMLTPASFLSQRLWVFRA